MKFTEILVKCLAEGTETSTKNTTVFKYTDSDVEHILIIYNRNDGKNVKGDVIYNRMNNDSISYTWKGNRKDLPKY